MGHLNLQFVQIDNSIEINEAAVWYKMVHLNEHSAVSAKHHSRITGTRLVAAEKALETSYLLTDLWRDTSWFIISHYPRF
jgi:hypothetical protein